MRRQLASFTLIVCGVVALALGMVVAPAPTPVAAMPALQPSPRPTLVPTADVPPRDRPDEPTPVPYGRITGTVIDARTGAPAANKVVVVGDSIVITDGSGNYDRWVIPGFYNVGLQLRSGEGEAAAGMQGAAVEPGGTTVMHLFFTSPDPAAALAVATPTPEPAAAAEPVAVAEPVRDLPAPAAPSALPDTAVGGFGVPGPFVIVGALLLGLGALLQARPRRRAAARAQSDARALRRMLSSAPKPTPEETLEELLRREP